MMYYNLTLIDIIKILLNFHNIFLDSYFEN